MNLPVEYCRILGGLKGRLAIWQLSRPGRDHDTLPVRLQGRQAGIVSTIACAPEGDMIAAGTFTSLVTVFDVRSFEEVSSVHGHRHGIMQLQFSRFVPFEYNSSGACQIMHTMSCKSSEHLVTRFSGVGTFCIQELAKTQTLYAGTSDTPEILCMAWKSQTPSPISVCGSILSHVAGIFWQEAAWATSILLTYPQVTW